MPNALTNKILIEGAEDWVPLGALYGWAKTVSDGPAEEQRRVIVAAVAELIRDGLIVCGEVINGRGFVASSRSTDEVLEQVELRVIDGGPEDFLLWFANTESGDAAAGQ